MILNNRLVEHLEGNGGLGQAVFRASIDNVYELVQRRL